MQQRARRSAQPFDLLVTLSLTPRPIIAIAWILFCGWYAGSRAIEQEQWILGVAAFGFVTAAVGVLLLWRWSQWLVYGLFALWIGTWLYMLAIQVRAGNFPTEGLEITMLQLVPGLAIVAAMVWSGDIVRRRFASGASRSNKSLERTRGE